MSIGTPYLIGTNTPASAASEKIAVATANGPGDMIVVALGNTSASGATITGVADDAGNTYSQVAGAQVTSHQFADCWVAHDTTPLTTSQFITVTWSGTSGTKNCVAVGVPGARRQAAPDAAVTNSANQGSGTSPSVTSGTPQQAGEMLIAIYNNASAGGAPTLGNGFSQIGQLHTSSNTYTTVGYLTGGTSAQTVSATILTATACIVVIGLLPAAQALSVFQAVNRSATY